MSNKDKKSKAQKRFERSKRAINFISSDEHPARKKTDYNKFKQDFLDCMSKHSYSKSEAEMREEVEKYLGICSLAWNLAELGGTYEKSIEELNLLSLQDSNLDARAGMKFLLIHALRMLFSLPADEKSIIRATVDSLTPEELDAFYGKIDSSDTGQSDTHPFLNIKLHEFFQKFLEFISRRSLSSSESEILKEPEKCVGMCAVAWALSSSEGTYEKSIVELNSQVSDKIDLSAQMAVKFIIIQALRILFSLPVDEKSLVQAVTEILTQEELNLFYEHIDLSGLD